jgi:hypothetical protein
MTGLAFREHQRRTCQRAMVSVIGLFSIVLQSAVNDSYATEPDLRFAKRWPGVELSALPPGNRSVVLAMDAKLRKPPTKQTVEQLLRSGVFPGSHMLLSPQRAKYFERLPAAERVTMAEGIDSERLLSVKGNADFKPGDIVLVTGGVEDYVLVYMGQYRFRDYRSRSFPFFVYLGNERLEINTFPARFHIQLLVAKGLVKVSGTSSGKARYKLNGQLVVPVKDSKGGRTIDWLQKPPIGKSVIARPGKSTYAIYRRRYTEFDQLWDEYPAALEWAWKNSGVQADGTPPYPCAMALSKVLGIEVPVGSKHLTWRLNGNKFKDVPGRGDRTTNFYIRAEELADQIEDFRKQKPRIIKWSAKADQEFLKSRTGILFFDNAYGGGDHIDLWNGPANRIRMVTASTYGQSYADADRDPGNRLRPRFSTARKLLFWEIE